MVQKGSCGSKQGFKPKDSSSTIYWPGIYYTNIFVSVIFDISGIHSRVPRGGLYLLKSRASTRIHHPRDQ